MESYFLGPLYFGGGGGGSLDVSHRQNVNHITYTIQEASLSNNSIVKTH
jgi:hypothetical protein